MTNEKFFELGYRIEEIASSSGKIQGGDNSVGTTGGPTPKANWPKRLDPSILTQKR